MNNRAKQSGAALLAFMLVIVTGASYLLVKKFNENAEARNKDEITLQALNDAKAALIGYAITYPDQVNPSEGPGYLPCPDISPLDDADSGSAGGSCSAAGDTVTGRFPHVTMRVPEIRDASGARLWYIVSDNYRYGTGKTEPMNSDVPGTIQINPGTLAPDERLDDIVAVLIAPGEPMDGQGNRNSDSDNPEEYLEFTQPDTEEYVWDTNTSNDRIVTISRTELMRTVERRVIGEFATKLAEYKTENSDLYPWLSNYQNPKDSLFNSEIGILEGHLGYHWSQDWSDNADEGGSSRMSMSTEFSIIWNIEDADINIDSSIVGNTVTEECLNNVDCINPDYPSIERLMLAGECEWLYLPLPDQSDIGTYQNYDLFLLFEGIGIDYESFESNIVPAQYVNCRNSSPTSIVSIDGSTVRTFEIDENIRFYGSAGLSRLQKSSINPDNPYESRIRRVNNDDPYFILMDKNNWLTITDVRNVDTVIYEEQCFTFWGFTWCFNVPVGVEETSEVVGRGSLSINSDSSVMLVSEIPYNIDVDAGEMPGWVFKNNWHHSTYIKYSDDECNASSDQIKLLGNIYDPDIASTIDSDVESTYEDYLIADSRCAIAMIAGAVIDTGDLDQTNRLNPAGSDQLGDYFELLNEDPEDGLFLMQRRGLEFNDQIRIIEDL